MSFPSIAGSAAWKGCTASPPAPDRRPPPPPAARGVHQLPALPPRPRPRLDVALGGELEMLALAPGDLLGFRHVGVFYAKTPSAASEAYSSAPRPRRPLQTPP